MRLVTITLIVLMSSISMAEKPELGDAIYEASVSQQRLHRRVLRILQGYEESIAENEVAPETPEQRRAAANQVQIRLTKTGTKAN